METASEDDKFKDSYVELEDHQSEDENQMFYHEHAEDSIGQESLLDRPWEPFVGMEFESAEALKTFYKTYASHLGFGIRAGVLRRSRTDDAVIMRSFLCSRESPEFDSNGKRKRNQSTTREDCRAMIEVKREDFNKWVVSKFVPEHTHALMPTSQLLGQSLSLSSHTTEKQTMPLFPSSMDSGAIEDGRSVRTNVGFSDDKVCGHIALQNGRHSADLSDCSLSYQEQDIFDLSEQVVQADLTSTASDPKCEPFLGMEFGSAEDAEAFYYIYARQTGFSVRKSFSRRSRRDDSIIMRSFVCAREGFHSMKISYGDGKRRQRKRMAVREGCKAMMEVVQRVQGKWVVTKFIKEHSHEVGGLTNVSCTPDGYENDAIPTSVSYLSLTRKSCGSYKGETRRDSFSGEAQELLEYLKRMQAKNPAFFYAVQVDNNSCISNVFWTDARARLAYSCFNDVVVFDTTYKKAKYMLPFAAFTGVNHHLQPINFGYALLVDETKGAYVWLFQTWLTAMGRRHPASMVTERDRAVEAGITRVFPNTRHHFCKWDILSRCKEKLGGLYAKHPTFKRDLKRCVNESETIQDFQICWESILDRYDLRESVWMHSLYDIRHQWVPAYQMDMFFAEMFPFQRPETLKKFFKKNFSTKTSIVSFATMLEQDLEAQYAKEVQADFTTLYTEPVVKTPSVIEKQAASVFTRTIFDKFQEEFVESLGYFAEKIEDDNHGVVNKYGVTKEEDAHKTYIVQYNFSDKKASCSCRKFELSGILCRHVLRLFFTVGLRILPDDYILKRWTRNAKSDCSIYERCIEPPQNFQESLNAWYNELCLDAIKYGLESELSVDVYKVAKQALQKAFAEVYAAKYMHKRDQQQLQRCTRAQKINYKRPLPNSPRKRTFAGCIQRSEHDNKKGDRTDACNEIEAAGDVGFFIQNKDTL